MPELVTTSHAPALATPSIPPAIATPHVRVSVRVAPREALTPGFFKLKPSWTRLSAGLTEIEPNLEEGKRDRWRTNSVSPEDFIYGEYDGHHTYHETPYKGTFWQDVMAEYEAAEPPSGFQGLMSWLFLPAIVAGLAYHVPGEYLYIGAAIFVVIFCGIEIAKPDKPHNFERQIYNMERGARDKLIDDYNTMDIWDFNEKYGELWDFTIKRDDIVR